MDLIRYRDSLYQQLIDFNRDMFNYPDMERYIQFRLFNNPYSRDENESILAIDDETIFGQALMMPMKYYSSGFEERGVWGVDLIVRPEIRGKGLGYVLSKEAMTLKNLFVFGVTPLSLKIQKAIGLKLIGEHQRFMLMRSFLTPVLLSVRRGNQPKTYRFPDKVTVGQDEFNLLKEPISWNKEYWNNHSSPP